MSSTRRSFVANSLLAAVASAIVPRSLKALTPCVPHGTRAAASTVLDLFSPTSPAPPATYNPSYFAIVDLHCHPSLKMYLWGRKLWHYHTAGLGVNAFDLQDDMAQLSTGTVPHDPAGPQYDGLVKGVVVAHYLPEAAIGEQWDVLKKIYPWIGRLFRGVTDKIEHGDATNITQIIAIIDLLNTQAEKASRKNHGVPFVIARSFQEFDDAIRDGKFPIAHAIEGAHALGRNKAQFRGRNKQPEQGTMQLAGQEAAAQYIRNLELLKSKGVCMMTLAHLFPNDIAACVEGISPDEKHSIGMGWHYTADDNLPLTNVGEAVVDWMLLKGMIVDLTHSTPKSKSPDF